MLAHVGRRPFHRFLARPQLDFKQMCREPEVHRANAASRNVAVPIDELVPLYRSFRELTAQAQALEGERNRLSRTGHGGDLERVKESVLHLKSRLAEVHERIGAIEDRLYEIGVSVPNSTHPETPVGTAALNRELLRFGPPVDREAACLDHVELGRRLDILDFEAGAKVSGSQHYFLKNQGALLELALTQYAISVCLKHGFKLVLPPDTAYAGFVRACGFSPRAAGGALPIYTVQQEEKDAGGHAKKALVGTAEIPLAGYHADQVLDASALPLKTVALGHCFRPEVGHHGAESRGLYRVHQFSKVEMFALSRPEHSQQQFDEIVRVQREILEGLGLSCRVLNMATEELGASAHCKYDIEAWFPGRKGWGELTSASNCTDFQTRRLWTRYREGPGRPLAHPHSLNGTACAVPRTIQAILENNQQPDGSVAIPQALRRFMLDSSSYMGP